MKTQHKQKQLYVCAVSLHKFYVAQHTKIRPVQKSKTKSTQNVLNEVWKRDRDAAFYYSFVEGENVYWKLVSCKKYFVSSFYWNYYEYDILLRRIDFAHFEEAHKIFYRPI